MKFFTPELFAELNSDDDDIVDSAEQNWQAAIVAYRRHIKRISTKLPRSLRRFSEEYCLHDAVVLPPSEQNEDFLPFLLAGPHHQVSTSAVIPVRSRDTLLVLWYLGTSKRPAVEQPLVSPVFQKKQVTWMYDEIDCVGNHQFSHEVLFSNGLVAKFIFSEFEIIEHVDFRLPADRRRSGLPKVRSKAS